MTQCVRPVGKNRVLVRQRHGQLHDFDCLDVGLINLTREKGQLEEEVCHKV